MSRISWWLAGWACVGMVMGPAMPMWAEDAPAATATSAKVTLNLSYIPAEAAAVLVAHPHDALTGPDAEWLPTEVITAAGVQNVGFDPITLKEAVVFVSPPGPASPEPGFGAILRFVDACPKAAILAKLPPMKEGDADGKQIYAGPTPRMPSIYFPDEKTLVLAPEPMLKKMIAAKDVDSPLVKLLKVVDVSSHLTFVGSVDAVRDLAKQAVATIPPLPPQFQDFLKLPDLVSAVLVKVSIGGGGKISATLRGTDEAAAAEIERIVNEGLTMGRQMVLAQMAAMPRGNDPMQDSMAKYMTRVSGKFFDLLKPVRRGANVTIASESNGSIAVIGILMGLLLPAVQSARGAARRVQSQNNMKQIGLALFNYEAANRRFPPRAIFSKDGKPLLSWRVAILPYIDEQNLYGQFHLDEPWDSAHNKQLIATMPMVYQDPTRPHDGKTTYLAPIGKGLAWEGDKGLGIADFTDGTSNTILGVQADEAHAIPWTKPDDLEVDLNKPADGLVNPNGPAFNVLMADGSVRSISNSADAETLKRLFGRNDGLPVDWSKLDQ
jgi:prepilin-type processing-associated H-X9-DG protein